MTAHQQTGERNHTRWGEAWDAFIARFPGYGETEHLDHARSVDLRRLDDSRHVYLDYTGSGLYPASLPIRHLDRLTSGVYGNPHSVNPASMAATRLVDEARERVLRYFNADPDVYDVIFTGNASGALRLIGESYPFQEGDQYLLTWDNHNSVNGMRQFAARRGATFTYVPVVAPDLRVDEAALDTALEADGRHKLFAFPAQSNFSGVKHPLEWIDKAQKKGWHVLLDAAAFAPTNRLDLGRWQPDFVCLSFYKMFGFPTGIGALIAKKEALEILERPWFSGGSIEVVSVQLDRVLVTDGHARFEDGTVDFLNIPAVSDGLDFIERIGVDSIQKRLECLTDWFLGQLADLRHPERQPLVRIYGPLTANNRGATVAFNIFDANGELVDQDLIEQRAADMNVSLRTGCFCNPGAAEAALDLRREAIDECLDTLGPDTNQDAFRDCLGSATGAVRISLGWGTTFDDLCHALDLLRSFTHA
jgi:selenocysteine lyase/cysteine desulfurase